MLFQVHFTAVKGQRRRVQGIIVALGRAELYLGKIGHISSTDIALHNGLRGTTAIADTVDQHQLILGIGLFQSLFRAEQRLGTGNGVVVALQGHMYRHFTAINTRPATELITAAEDLFPVNPDAEIGAVLVGRIVDLHLSPALFKKQLDRLYQEDVTDAGVLTYGFQLDPAAQNPFAAHYNGSEKCCLFVSPYSVNFNALNEYGTAGNDGALKAAQYLLEMEQ